MHEFISGLSCSIDLFGLFLYLYHSPHPTVSMACGSSQGSNQSYSSGNVRSLTTEPLGNSQKCPFHGLVTITFSPPHISVLFIGVFSCFEWSLYIVWKCCVVFLMPDACNVSLEGTLGRRTKGKKGGDKSLESELL